MAIAPGSATVVVLPEPDAELCAPIAWLATVWIPLHPETSPPPSFTAADRYARTARPGFVAVSGKFWTFVATYVAIELPPAVTYSTSW